MAGKPLACRVLGHAWVFGAEDATVVWRCRRGCGEGGRREYESAREARRFASHLNRGAPGPPAGFLAALGGTVARRGPDRRDD